MPSRSGLTACQMSMNGCPTMRTCWPSGLLATCWAIRASLLPETRWSTSTPARRVGPGSEVAQVVGQVVDAFEVLDHDALDPQVVAPDLLDQLGVVPALDEDAAGSARPGRAPAALRVEPEAVRVMLRRRCAGRRDQDHRRSLEQESRTERKGTASSAAVLELDGVEVTVDPDDLAAPVGGDLFDDQTRIGLDLDRPAALGRAPVGVEHVGAVPVVGHGTDATGGQATDPVSQRRPVRSTCWQRSGERQRRGMSTLGPPARSP